MTPHGTLSFELTNDLAEMSLLAEYLERFCTRQRIAADLFVATESRARRRQETTLE